MGWGGQKSSKKVSRFIWMASIKEKNDFSVSGFQRDDNLGLFSYFLIEDIEPPSKRKPKVSNVF